MQPVNINGVDLNLLPVLEALLRHRNVSRAAQEVGLSQPAASRALARLRDVLEDPLLLRVRGGKGGSMALTAKAERLLPRVKAALDALRGVYREPVFDPATAERVVRIVAADVHTVGLMPAVAARLAREAPGISLRIESYGPDLIKRMISGEIDFAFALSSSPLPPGALSQLVMRDRLALVMRKGHRWSRRRWVLADYAAVGHVGVSLIGDGQSDIDRELAALGLARRMALVTPHFIAALATVGASDLVTTVSRRLTERFADVFGLVLLEPPLIQAELDVTLVWSQLRSGDPVLDWVRSVIASAGAAVTPKADD